MKSKTWICDQGIILKNIIPKWFLDHLLHAKTSIDYTKFTVFLFNLLEVTKGLGQNIAQNFLELSAFFIQFLQVWNAERSNYSFSSLPVVPPPPQDNRALSYKGKCPLCLQNWKISTVLPVSGYVFCFPCIIRHLREHLCCPVTNLPAKPLDVIRLYDSSDNFVLLLNILNKINFKHFVFNCDYFVFHDYIGYELKGPQN